MNLIGSSRIYLFVIVCILMSSCARPIANFTYTAKKKEAPAEVVFENKSEKAETYEWDFGDGTKSTDASPNHKYKNSGNYTVVLKAIKDGKSKETKREVNIDVPKFCLVELQTSYGNMIIQLSDATPGHRDNFIKLVEDGFYDDLLFHRVIDGFMIQGGDPKSKNAKANMPLGSGGPGYQIPAEFVDTLVHVKGALAAARTNNPEKKSSGSQFYIVQGRPVSERELSMMEARKDIRYTQEQREIYMKEGGTPQLDKEYTVFGMVIEGMEVIDKIAKVKTGRGDRPGEDVKMKMIPIR